MNTVNVTVLEAGQRNLIVSVFLQSDGASGDLNGEVIVTPTQFGYKTSQRFSLYRIDYNFAGFDAIVEFDSGTVTPTFKWSLSEGANAPVDFSYMGGIKDTSGMDGDGSLLLSTSGFTSTTDFGSILFKLRMPG